MSKKILYIATGVISIVLIYLVLWHFGYTFDFKRDAVKFKSAYESYNGTMSKTGALYKTVTIPKENKIKYINIDETLTKLKSGDSLIYISSPTNTINRLCVETIIDKITNSKVEKLYYFELTSKNDDYNKIIDELKIEELTLPNILAIKNGELVGNLNTDYILENNLSAFDKKQLEKNIEELIDLVLKENTYCDETC